MTYRELRTMIRQLSDYQMDRLGQMAAHFLELKQELAETKPSCCPVCGDENAVFIRKASKTASSAFSASPAGTNSLMTRTNSPPVRISRWNPGSP